MNLVAIGSLVRSVLTALTNLKDALPLPQWTKDGLQWGRDKGLWKKGKGPDFR